MGLNIGDRVKERGTGYTGTVVRQKKGQVTIEFDKSKFLVVYTTHQQRQLLIKIN